MELLHTDTLEEAREKLKLQTADFKLRTYAVSCADSLGCICGEDVTAGENVPPFRRSTVDGYAVIAGETYGAGDANPIFFRVSGHVDIEKRAETGVHPGEAVLVQTGSMIPEQATAVLMVEYTESYAADKIVAYRAVSEGENIIQIGEDIKAGESLIPRGRKISARDIGMMAALGITEVKVLAPPELTVISTGNELADIDEPLSGSKIRDINAYALAAEAVSNGFRVRKKIRVPDDETMIFEAVSKAAAESDIVLLSGGSSKGSRDYTKSVLERVTQNVFTHGISVKHGKPTILSVERERRVIIAGLPGHPMAALLMFRLLILDWYRQKAGIAAPKPYFAVMQENVSSNQGRAACLPVRLVCGETDYGALPVYAKSGSISALSKADGYVMIPRNKEGLKKGERVRVEVWL